VVLAQVSDLALKDGLAAGSTCGPFSIVVDGTLTLHDLSILSDPFLAF